MVDLSLTYRLLLMFPSVITFLPERSPTLHPLSRSLFLSVTVVGLTVTVLGPYCLAPGSGVPLGVLNKVRRRRYTFIGDSTQ